MDSQEFPSLQSNYPPSPYGNPQQPNNNQQPPYSQQSYYPPPQQPPQKPSFFKRKIGCLPMRLLVLFFVIFLYSCGSAPQTSSTPTQAPTQAQPTNTPAVPTQPKATPTKQTGLA